MLDLLEFYRHKGEKLKTQSCLRDLIWHEYYKFSKNENSTLSTLSINCSVKSNHFESRHYKNKFKKNFSLNLCILLDLKIYIFSEISYCLVFCHD